MIDHTLLLRPPDPALPTVATDLEGTLSGGSTVRAIHRYLEEIGMAAASRRIYRRRMPGLILGRTLGLGLRKMKNDWMRDLMRQFAGFSADDLGRMTEYVTENSIWIHRRQPLLDELNTHLGSGRRVIIVSGMSIPILRSLLKRMPGCEAIGTTVLGPEEPFSGDLGEFNVGRRKVDALRSFCDADGKIHAAYGDTYSDLEMLDLSRHPTAVAPDRKLRKAAEARGWPILDR